MKVKYRYTKLLILFAGVLLLFSCDELFNCLDGNGVLKTEKRFVTEFYGVENHTDFDVEIIADRDYGVEVIADENLLSYIKTSVRDGNLIVDTDNDRCIKSRHDIVIEVRMPSIDMIELTGSGNIDADDFDCNNIEIRNSGSGDIDILNIVSPEVVDIVLTGSGDIVLWGKARKGIYTLSGSGNIEADDFKVEHCEATNSGSGNIYCYVYDFLRATISGSGDIFYSGSPAEIIEEDSGSGELRSRN
jgi:hypothetical protein